MGTQTHITDLVNDKVSKIKTKNNVFDSGKVIKIKDYIIEVSGLENVMYFEKVIIMEKGMGYVNAIYEHSVSVAIVKENSKIEMGDVVNATGEIFKAVFSEDYIGRITDIFGVDQLTGKTFERFKYIDIERPNVPIMDRTAVCRPLFTGLAGIDLIYPIGKGQRQLIIGDKKTGKTQIALDTIANQGLVSDKDNPMICVYVAVGKTKKEIKTIYNELLKRNALSYTIMVVATNDDKTPVISLIPYVGMSIAEEYMYQGRDVLVVIDDLKRHAEIYREISLISNKTPGREAYPADIFYTHSRLLEKGCQHKNGGSITVLPIVETKGGDITDYISTNIISITDGQIVLSNKSFLKGQKPAIDYGVSVSRLGGAVQTKEIKKLGATVRLKLLNYLETRDVYELTNTDELSEDIREKLKEGRKIEMLLRQEKFEPFSSEEILDRFEDFGE
jgi:F-type H+-transporting ATPase subunit alpha